ncbi:MAG: PfaD family polyunsaturated fatty acid/polyketide biosynthesis protein [Oscillospiraceae bacterium]|jgi:PfaD family protein|nr:PfaD family polyunsaturated fatty acid/polyketide biosynthesis protein [Oscillospiraceae bacterium]
MNNENVTGYLKNYDLLDAKPLTMPLYSGLLDMGVRAVSVLKTRTGFRLAIGGELCDKIAGDAAPLHYIIPVVSARDLGSGEFCRAYGTDCAYYAGAMANAISSDDMVIALGKAGYMGSYGSGGMSPDVVEQAIDRIQEALPRGPYLINLLHAQNDGEREEQLVSLFLRKSVKAIEASAFVEVSPALVRYRLTGLAMSGGAVRAENKIIAKVSREEVAEKFMIPPDRRIVEELVAKGLVTAEQAELAKNIPMADDITAEADSGGHTDGRPLVSLLPLMIAVRDEIQLRYAFNQPVRVGAAGGIGTALSAAGAFMMGADYVVTGSVNQACLEAGTCDYVKQALAKVEMSDVVMAPSADMFESGARVQVVKKGTMFPMNAQKLYELYTRFGSLEEIPEKDKKSIETRLFHNDFETVWGFVKEYFEKVDANQIRRAETNAKYKMALVFRWYLGNSSRWAVRGEQDRKMDMQVWCGKSMGAFNRWVADTELEQPENRTVVAVADKIMREAAFITMRKCLKCTDFTEV